MLRCAPLNQRLHQPLRRLHFRTRLAWQPGKANPTMACPSESAFDPVRTLRSNHERSQPPQRVQGFPCGNPWPISSHLRRITLESPKSQHFEAKRAFRKRLVSPFKAMPQSLVLPCAISTRLSCPTEIPQQHCLEWRSWCQSIATNRDQYRWPHVITVTILTSFIRLVANCADDTDHSHY